MTDNRIHMVAAIKLPSKASEPVKMETVCNAQTWERITDIPAKVTCADCKKILETK